MITQHCSGSGRDCDKSVNEYIFCGWFIYLMEDGMNVLRERCVLTVGIPEGRRSYWSCRKWVGSDKIFFAICSVLDLNNGSRLVSGVQHPAILQYVYMSYLISLGF